VVCVRCMAGFLAGVNKHSKQTHSMEKNQEIDTLILSSYCTPTRHQCNQSISKEEVANTITIT
jgi:hypothetical protein